MSQSLTAIYIHAVFGTKRRRPFIICDIEHKLHAYIAGILKNTGSDPIKINSMPDHMHILFRMSKNHSISQIMQIVKKDSSKWMKKAGYKDFNWQIGYGAFSVSQSKVKVVSNYVSNQKEHHRKKTFVEEVDRLMELNNVDQYSKDFFWK